MTTKPVFQPSKFNERFLKPTQVNDKWGINLVVYGPAGVGKTTFAASAQDSEYGKDVLFIDVEGGVRSIADRDDITVFRPESFDEIRDLYLELKSGSLPFKTVVVDSIGEAQALGLTTILRSSKTGITSLQDYGKSNEQITGFVRGLRGMAQSNGINVVFTALAVETKDETTGAVLTRPALTPKARETIIGAVDMCGYLTQNRDGTRVLKFAPHPNYEAKLRQPMGGEQIPLEIVNPKMSDLLDIMRRSGDKRETDMKT